MTQITNRLVDLCRPRYFKDLAHGLNDTGVQRLISIASDVRSGFLMIHGPIGCDKEINSIGSAGNKINL